MTPSPPLTPDGLYCPGCGYDLRGLGSDRCPECGMAIDPRRTGIIAWEQRKSIGYFRSFIRTLTAATFRPVRLARATGSPVDVRSARLFRWIVRVLLIVPCIALFVFIVNEHDGGIQCLGNINGPGRSAQEPFWEAHFLWCVGATLWPVLPIGFVIAVILATGISPWFYMGRLESVRINRAMAFSYYLCAPLGWIAVPTLATAMVLYGYYHEQFFGVQQLMDFFSNASLPIAILTGGILLLAMANSVRAVDAATNCGILRSLLVAVGVIVQCAAAIMIGLGLFPLLAGLLRLMWSSVWR